MKNQLTKILALSVGFISYYLLLLLSIPLSYPVYALAIGDGTVLGHVNNDIELAYAVSRIPIMFAWTLLLVFVMTFTAVRITGRFFKPTFQYHWFYLGSFVTFMYSKPLYSNNKYLFVSSCAPGMLGADASHRTFKVK